MKYLNSLSLPTRVLIITTAIFLLYGFLCRLLGIYFFWESQSIGWALFFVSLIVVLLDRVKKKKTQKAKAIGEKIGIGISILVLVVKALFFFVVPHTDIYAAAEKYIKANEYIQSRTGTVNDVFFIPGGKISMQSTVNGSTGQANLQFVVKGANKFIDLNLLMVKDIDTADWQIIINE